MAETTGKTKTIRISNGVLIALGVLLALTFALALFIIPSYGKTVAAYREQHDLYKAAAADLETAQAENAALTERLEELKTLSRDIETNRAETFRLAAELEQDIIAGKSDKKICYITLDDGPYNRGKKWLEFFAKHDIKATFFLTTANGDKLPDQGDLSARSMYPEYLKYGHTIGNHTYSHNYSSGGVYSGPKTFMKSVEKQQDFTAKATGGYKPQIVRFPGGMSMAGSQLGAIQEALRKSGYGWIDWTVDSGDSLGSDKVSTSMIKSNIMGAAEKQKIMVILCHEWSQKSLDAMPDIVEHLEKEGFIFLPLFYDSAMVEK